MSSFLPYLDGSNYLKAGGNLMKSVKNLVRGVLSTFTALVGFAKRSGGHRRSWNLLVIAGLAALNIIGIAYVTASNSSGSKVPSSYQVSDELAVDNLAPSFEVLEAKVRDGRARILLRNASSKIITNFAVSLAPEDGYVRHQQGIPPGGSHEIEMTVRRVAGAPAAPRFTILAVIFDDSSGQGDEKLITELQDDVTAGRINADLIYTILRGIRVKDESELVSALDAARSRAEALERDVKQKNKPELANRLRSGHALRLINELEDAYREHGWDLFREHLARLKQDYQDRRDAYERGRKLEIPR